MHERHERFADDSLSPARRVPYRQRVFFPVHSSVRGSRGALIWSCLNWRECVVYPTVGNRPDSNKRDTVACRAGCLHRRHQRHPRLRTCRLPDLRRPPDFTPSPPLAATSPASHAVGWKDTKYALDYEGGYVEQQNVPGSWRHYELTERGYEAEIRKRMEELRRREASQESQP
jgi:hypothetical protein